MITDFNDIITIKREIIIANTVVVTVYRYT